MKKTIIVIPTYNEVQNIEKLIEDIFIYVPEVLVMIVDDNSPDGTALIVNSLMGKYPNLILFEREKKEGLGVAYKAGFKRALELHPDTEILGMMDADLSHRPADLPKLFLKINNYDVIIGSSMMDKEGRAHYPLLRNLISKFANFYCSVVLKEKLSDWTNAYMMIRINALKKVDMEQISAKEHAFIFALKYTLLKKKFRVKEISTPAFSRMYGRSKIKMSTIIEAIIIPWRIRNNF